MAEFELATRPVTWVAHLLRGGLFLLRLVGAWLASAICLLVGMVLSAALGGTTSLVLGFLAFAFVLVSWLQAVETGVAQAFFPGADRKAKPATGWMLCTYGLFFLTQTLGVVVGFLSCLEIGHV